MKKFFAIIMTIFLLASALCVNTFAASDVITVSAQKKGGTLEVIDSFDSFEEGWSYAMKIAGDTSTMKKERYERIVVDINDDWKADSDGNFTDDAWYQTNDDSFNNDTIYIPAKAKVTINLGGHTIDRKLSEAQGDGEVIYIAADADVIINNGTITGGFSDNGAGGIHVKDNARVTLNDVHVDGNCVEDDDGAGIAVYGGAELIMNGGSISGNTLYTDDVASRGALCVKDGSTATLTDVIISGNDGEKASVFYVHGGELTLTNCIVENNAKYFYSASIFYMYDADLYIDGGEIKNNGYESKAAEQMFMLYDDINMTVSDCKITGNKAEYMFMPSETINMYCDFSGCEFTDNYGLVSCYPHRFIDTAKYTFTDCKFNNNNTGELHKAEIVGSEYINLKLIDCDLGDTVLAGKNYIDFGNGAGVGSLFGTGSLTMIVAILALVASCASVYLVVDLKKKLVPATANKAAETDDEE